MFGNNFKMMFDAKKKKRKIHSLTFRPTKKNIRKMRSLTFRPTENPFINLPSDGK